MPEPANGATSERIARRLARAGLCSRREAERWIADGRVAVDGEVLATPAVVVGAGSRITVDGKPLPAAAPTRLWRYHKPRGLICTLNDPRGRPTVFAALPPELPRVVSVGRLDINSEGLLLLTNDGALARLLEMPASGWLRRYRVRVHGRPDADALDSLARGVTVDGVAYGPAIATIDRRRGSNAWLVIDLREGKNREVRRLMAHVGLAVNRIVRIAYGPIELGELRPGAIAEVPARVIAKRLARTSHHG